MGNGNDLQRPDCGPDRLAGQEVEELNIPTGAHVRYDFDRELRPVVRGGGYLDPDSARVAAAAVAAEGQA